MKKSISLLALASILAAGTAYASGYRIPEQSPESVAKAGAHIASSVGADSSYYNPANMSWAADSWLTEIDLTYIGLASIDYTDVRTPAFNGSTETENFVVPTFFVVSPDYSNFRFGLSLTAPYGLAKRWNDYYPSLFAQKFELKVFDLNPNVSYEINDYFSIAGGVRAVFSTATARFGGAFPTGVVANLDLDLSGTATGSSNVPAPFSFDSDADVTLPAPAIFTLAAAYDWDDLTVEIAWDRTMWSEYEELNFNFVNPMAEAVFGPPRPKNWDDTDAFRISAAYAFNEAFTGMVGFALDDNPVPDNTLSFELPDSDAMLFSIGGRYMINEQMACGVGLLYDHKDSRTVNNATVAGEFDNASALLISAGFSYTF
ncbi:MAG: outer membrane protein transport protein [Desulfofustis sp.]